MRHLAFVLPLLGLLISCSLLDDLATPPNGAAPTQDAAHDDDATPPPPDDASDGDAPPDDDAPAEDAPASDADTDLACPEACDLPPGADPACAEPRCEAGACTLHVREGEPCGAPCQQGGTCNEDGRCVGAQDTCPNSDSADPCRAVSTCLPEDPDAGPDGCKEVLPPPTEEDLPPPADPCLIYACTPCRGQQGCPLRGYTFTLGPPQIGLACDERNRLVCGLPAAQDDGDACDRLRCDAGRWVTYDAQPITCDLPVVCADDGAVARSYMTCGGRSTQGLLAFWGFSERRGDRVHNLAGRNGAPGRDWSAVDGFSPADLDLAIREPNGADRITWREGVVGLRLGPKDQGSKSLLRTEQAPGPVYARLASTGAFTVEVWLRVASDKQKGPVRIVTLSTNTTQRNLTLGQEDRELRLRLRGLDELTIRDVFSEPAGLEWTHLVVTYANAEVRVFINGALRQRLDAPLDLTTWDATSPVGLGNELSAETEGSDEYPWSGELGLVALFDRALEEAEVRQHFAAGVPRGLYNALP